MWITYNSSMRKTNESGFDTGKTTAEVVLPKLLNAFGFKETHSLINLQS